MLCLDLSQWFFSAIFVVFAVVVIVALLLLIICRYLENSRGYESLYVVVIQNGYKDGQPRV